MIMAEAFHQRDYDITVSEIHRNLPPSRLYKHAIRYEKDTSTAENGVLVAYSGVKTGRSPKDKLVVKHPMSEADVWWGPVEASFAGGTVAAHCLLCAIRSKNAGTRMGRTTSASSSKRRARINEITNAAPEVGFGDYLRNELEARRHDR
jgi:ATP-dependent phosphoenolpyruvate carboxykinase